MGERDHAAMAALRTGDLVLFGRDPGRAGILRWFANRAWCDVALVVRPEDAAEPLVLEARSVGGTGSSAALVSLSRRLRGFRGKVSVRRLSPPLSRAQCERLATLHRGAAGHERARTLVELMTAADDGWYGARPEMLGAPTGDELVAEFYQHLGLLDTPEHGGRPAHAFSAQDFAAAAELQLNHGFALGPELPLQEPAIRTPVRLVPSARTT